MRAIQSNVCDWRIGFFEGQILPAAGTRITCFRATTDASKTKNSRTITRPLLTRPVAREQPDRLEGQGESRRVLRQCKITCIYVHKQRIRKYRARIIDGLRRSEIEIKVAVKFKMRIGEPETRQYPVSVEYIVLEKDVLTGLGFSLRRRRV